MKPILTRNLYYISTLTADTITAVEFDGSGDFLATGDRGGRIVLFTKNSSSDSEGVSPDFSYFSSLSFHLYVIFFYHFHNVFTFPFY